MNFELAEQSIQIQLEILLVLLRNQMKRQKL